MFNYDRSLSQRQNMHIIIKDIVNKDEGYLEFDEDEAELSHLLSKSMIKASFQNSSLTDILGESFYILKPIAEFGMKNLVYFSLDKKYSPQGIPIANIAIGLLNTYVDKDTIITNKILADYSLITDSKYFSCNIVRLGFRVCSDHLLKEIKNAEAEEEYIRSGALAQDLLFDELDLEDNKKAKKAAASRRKKQNKADRKRLPPAYDDEHFDDNSPPPAYA